MGFYINPPTMSKEAFLAANGRRIRRDEAMEIIKAGVSFPVALIDNGAFTAAAIGYSADEVEYFLRDASGRPSNGERCRTRRFTKLSRNSGPDKPSL